MTSIQDADDLEVPVRAGSGDPSDAIRPSKVGGPPYCFRLENGDPNGSLGSLRGYVPSWDFTGLPYNNRQVRELKEEYTEFYTKRSCKGSDAPTHVALNKLRFRINTPQEEEQFLKLYSKLVLAGKKMYLAERPTPVIRVFMDLDFKQVAPISEFGIEAAAVVCSKVVHEFFPSKESTVVVSATTYKREEYKDEKGLITPWIKTGVHFSWPNFFVTQKQMLDIRESVLAKLLESFGGRTAPNYNPWEDVIDDAPYNRKGPNTGSGLKMIGSFKCKQCHECKFSKADKTYISTITNAKCKTCDGHGNLEDRDVKGRGRPYMLLCVLGGPSKSYSRDLDSETDYKSSFEKLVFDTKTRTFLEEFDEVEPENGFVLPSGAPVYLGMTTGKRRQKGPAGLLAPTVRGDHEVVPTSPAHAELQTIIREAFGSHYAQVVVNKVFKGSKRYKVNVSGPNSHYCQNIGREHRSNRIYFEITVDGIVQRCLDNGDLTPEMKHGRCQEYASSRIVLSARSLAILWPDTNDAISVFNSTEHTAEQSIFQTFSMQTLLNAGEYLATALYGTSWTSTLNLRSNASKSKKGLQDYIPIDPRDLGSRGIAAYKDLGLSWADSLIKLVASRNNLHDSEDEERRQSRGPIVPIARLEKELYEVFQTVVALAASATDPHIFDAFESLNDFLAPMEAHETEESQGEFNLMEM
jgi:hypothetical protein